MKKSSINFYSVDEKLPMFGLETIVRSGADEKGHYSWAFAIYKKETACRRWVESQTGDTLYFEPVEWAVLPELK